MATIYAKAVMDLDTACAVWAAKTFWAKDPDAEVVLVPPDWDPQRQLADTELAVDVEAGGQGIRGKLIDGGRTSTFSEVVSRFAPADDYEVLTPVMEYVDRFDMSRTPYESMTRAVWHRDGYITSLAGIFRGLAVIYDSPMDTLDTVHDIMDGLLEVGRHRRQAAKFADHAKWIQLDGLCAAISEDVPGKYSVTVNGLLFERGADVVVFSQGNNIGALRSDRYSQTTLDHPEVRRLVDREPGWFFHRNGYLVARGTRTNPAKTPSNVCPYDLARAAVRALAAQLASEKEGVAYGG